MAEWKVVAQAIAATRAGGLLELEDEMVLAVLAQA
jgi:hypothetical protein